MNSHQDDYLIKTSSKSCSQASHFALMKFSFAYFKQPKQIFWLKMEPSLDPFFALLSTNSVTKILVISTVVDKNISQGPQIR